eukprot:Polyplicarium_translucidae@DN1891_c0_g1_i12.p1
MQDAVRANENGSDDANRSMSQSLLEVHATSRAQLAAIRSSRQTTDRLFWDGFQWVTRSDASITGVFDQHMNATRRIRRLHIGNVPMGPEATEENFRLFLTAELHARGMAVTPCPVVHVWFSKERGRFGFLEMATMEEAASVLAMDGLLWHGHGLRMTRPADVQRSLADPNAAADLREAVRHGSAAVDVFSTPLPDHGITTSIPPPRPSKVLRFLRPSKEEELQTDEDFEELLEDVTDGVASCGTIKARLVVTPAVAKQLPFSGVGDIFFEFERCEEAQNCANSMSQRTYDGQSIRICEIEQSLWDNSIAVHAEKL